MKKSRIVAIITVAILTLSLTFALTACNPNPDDPHNIVVGASASPHAEILNVVKDVLKQQGYKLYVKVFDDYITPNTALEEGSVNANYFQHAPYLESFNADYGTHLVAVDKIHYEPLGVYGKDVDKASYDSVKTGRVILVPNDPTNLTRALFVLADEGFITLPAGADPRVNLTVHDISANGNTITPLKAEDVALHLRESASGTLAVINGNYAIQNGLDITNVLGTESADGEAAQLYANIIAVKEGHENDDKIKALVNALKSQQVIDYINNTYHGAVRPSFSL